jgi:uncharacterized membrane protein
LSYRSFGAKTDGLAWLKNVGHQQSFKNMKARDIFGLIVRTVGLFLIIYSSWNVMGGVYSMLTGQQFGAYFFYGIPGLLVGILLVGLARYFVRFSYPGNKDDSDS